MNNEAKISALLRLTPTHFLCPYCGDLHEVDESPASFTDWIFSSLKCPKVSHSYYSIGFRKDDFHIEFRGLCCDIKSICESIPLSKIVVGNNSPFIYWYVQLHPIQAIDKDYCNIFCLYKNFCAYQKSLVHTDSNDVLLKLGLKFEEDEFFSILESMNSPVIEKNESQIKEDSNMASITTTKKEEEDSKMAKATSTTTTKKEETSKMAKTASTTTTKKEETSKMAKTASTTKTRVLEQLYEHSPKENIELVKQYAEKYKPTLRWAIPVIGIYVAYRILNSKNSAISVDNVGDICEKELGFNMDCLKDKTILKELMVLGGMSAGACAAIKAGSAIFNTTTSSEVSVKDVEDGMEKLEGVHKKFGWIQPKTEKLLPVALSVIVVYIMAQKPANLNKLSNKVKQLTGDWAIKVNVFIEMAKLFISDKLHINLENEDDKQKTKKFILLATIVAIGVFIYGRKILNNTFAETDNPESKGMQLFVEQVLSIMKKLMPAAFVGTGGWIIVKKFLYNEDIDFDDIAEDLRDDEDVEDAEENSDFTEV